MSDDTVKEKGYTCTSCHGGHVKMEHVAYLTWVGGELITVPDFPAWICDICGGREYDQRALTWLNIILSPDTGRKRPKTSPPTPPLQRSAIQPDI